jgi:hypothetical protein
METLASIVTALHQTLATEVLPAWFKQVESDQKHAEHAFKQAGRSLAWTKWAVIASVVITILATWWQISVSRELDRENSAQQQRTENLLREQLATQKKQLEQQRQDTEQLRDAILVLKQKSPGKLN